MRADMRAPLSRQGNERLGQLYGLLEDAAHGPSTSETTLHKDEGMVLIAQMLLMSGCEAGLLVRLA